MFLMMFSRISRASSVITRGRIRKCEKKERKNEREGEKERKKERRKREREIERERETNCMRPKGRKRDRILVRAPRTWFIDNDII